MPLPLRAEIKVVRQQTHLILIFKEHYNKTFCFKVDKTLLEKLYHQILLNFSWRVNITYEDTEIHIISVWEYKIKGIPGIKWNWGCAVEEVILIEKMSRSLVRTQRLGSDVVMSARRKISPHAIMQRDLEHSAHLYSQRWPPGTFQDRSEQISTPLK